MKRGFLQHSQNGVCFYTVPGWEGVRHCFTTRLGGVSDPPFASLNLGVRRGDSMACVQENLKRISACIHTPWDKTVLTTQTHTDCVRPVTLEDAGKGYVRPTDIADVDGFITDVPDLPIACYTADCVPLLLFDPVRRAVGAVHAGWRGTVQKIGKKAVELMAATYGCKPEHVLCAIGPSIGPCHFETDEDVPRALRGAFGIDFAEPHSGGKYRVDLWQANAAALQEAGVPQANITVGALCTMCRNDLFFSNRAEHGKMGNNAAIICLSTERREKN